MTETVAEFPRARVIELRVKSKTGRGLTDEEYRFIAVCWKRWPKEYASTSAEVDLQARRFVCPWP